MKTIEQHIDLFYLWKICLSPVNIEALMFNTEIIITMKMIFSPFCLYSPLLYKNNKQHIINPVSEKKRMNWRALEMKIILKENGNCVEHTNIP